MGCLLEILEVTTVDLRKKPIWNNHTCRNKGSKAQKTLKPENQTRHTMSCYCPPEQYLCALQRQAVQAWLILQLRTAVSQANIELGRWLFTNEEKEEVLCCKLSHGTGAKQQRDQLFWSLGVLLVCSKDQEVWLLLPWGILMASLTSVKPNKYQTSPYYHSFPLCPSIPAKGRIWKKKKPVHFSELIFHNIYITIHSQSK